MGKVGLIDVGGGFRGIYTPAVLDRCLDDGVSFDLGIGVSAGGGNIASFIAGQRGRSRRFYADYGPRKEHAGFGWLLRKRSFLSLDCIYGALGDRPNIPRQKRTPRLRNRTLSRYRTK